MKDDVLEYIGLDFNKLPKTKFKENPIHFSDYSSSKIYKIYDYVSVKDLEILITPLERTADLKERYKTAKPLIEYLKTDDSKMKKIFLQALESASVEEIKKLEELQEKMSKELPYFVKYDKNYLWQIYYSKEDDRYFMLFPANEGETSVLFYIIKKKLERKNTKIFVPINKLEYSGEILNSNEVTDIENYIWLFTNEWTNIYEINKEKLYIVGKTKVKGIFDSYYRNIYASKEEAQNFYMLLKAMFILTTETNYKYTFEPYININGELELKYKEKNINTENLSSFIDEQTEFQKKKQIELKQEIEKGEKELKSLKEYVKQQNDIYVMQEKQIVMFMQCKKSFFKKISYFFKSKKFTTPQIKEEVKIEGKTSNIEIETGGSYTIKELISAVLESNNIETKVRDLRADIKALRLKKENLARKIKNASSYIAEIEKHKKSIFEFWKFSNKDALPALDMGDENANEKKVEGAFNLEQDLEILGSKVDGLQRQKLSSDECNAIYITKNNLNAINFTDEDKKLEAELRKLKNKINKEENNLGNLFEDYSESKKLNNREHRENRRNELRILKISKDTKLQEFRSELENNKRLLKEAYNKIKAISEIEVYVKELDKKSEYCIGEINPKKIFEETEKDLKLYKVRIEQGSHLLYFSNIIFFTNTNKTLPLGMDISTEVLIKTPQIDPKKTKSEEVNLLLKKDDFNCNIRKIEISG